MKTVLLPIEVPDGIFCQSCESFDNKGGHGKCYLKLGYPKNGPGGYLKPDECMDLIDTSFFKRHKKAIARWANS